VKEEISLPEPHEINDLNHSINQQVFIAKGAQFC
jgi:hypothetical protein